MSGSCGVRGRRFAQPWVKNWPISPGPSCSSGPHFSLPVITSVESEDTAPSAPGSRPLRWHLGPGGPRGIQGFSGSRPVVAAMRTAHAGPVTGLIAQVLLLAALAGTVGLSGAGWVFGLTCAVILNATLAHGLSRYRSDRLGAADW